MRRFLSQELPCELNLLFSEFITFVMIYIVISLLWYISLLQLCGNIIHNYLWKRINTKDSKLGIHYGAIVTLLAGIFS